MLQVWKYDPARSLHSYEFNVVLNCTINQSFPYDSSSLYFTHKPNMSIPEKEMPEEYVTVVNNWTISLRKTIESLDEAGTYSCKIRGDVKHSVVDRQMVEVEYPLRNVTDFHCMIYDWDVNKSCTWNLGPYVNLENINVSLYGKHCISLNACSRIPNIACPFQTADKQECRWYFGSTVFDSRFFRGQMFVRNKRADQVLRHDIHLQVASLVKPAPVISINVFNTSDKGCVNLTWEYKRPNRPQAVEIKYFLYGKAQPSIQTLILKNTAVNSTICNLASFSEYKFEIRVKPQNEAGNITGYWSDKASKLFKTMGDYPSAAPVLSLGSYTSNPEQCIHDSDDRKVMVLWKSIPHMASNGNEIFYEVHIRQIGETQTKRIEVKEMINKVDLDLKCRNGYIISVYAVNEYGLSSVFGSVTVPPNGTVEVPLNVQIETDDKVVNVSWDYNPQKNVSFTVYWCSKRGLRKEASWRRAGFEKRFLVFNASEFEEISDLKFGVSADSFTDNISSGFEWNTCVYKITEAPDAPRKVSILSNENGLVVNWIPPTCDEMTSKPVKYRLSWCQTDGKSDKCLGPLQSRFILADDSVDYTYRLFETDVEMSQWYGIVIKSISRLNKTSAPTEMFHGLPVRNYLIPAEILGISIASLVVLLIIVAGVMWSIQSCYRFVKSYVKPDPISLPTVQTCNAAGSGVSQSAYKESAMEPAPHSPIKIPLPPSPRVRKNGIPFQNQYSMDSGRGSLPVEDVLETHPPIPESLDDDGADEPVPFIHLPSPQPESCLYDATDNSCIRASSSSLTNYRAICQATESDSSDEETSSVISEMQEELRPYIKAGSHNSADQINSLPDYVNYDVKSGPSTPTGERHAYLKRTLLTHSCLDITKCNRCVHPERGSDTSLPASISTPDPFVNKVCVISSSKHNNPAYNDNLDMLPSVDMCNILISVDSSLSMERRLTDELDNVSVNSVNLADTQETRTSRGDLSSSVSVIASSDYLPIDSMQFTSSGFSVYNSSGLVS
uniref:Uncharacterized protein LOC111119401 isoform X2 n=1 Tax=Crassostrea virginica TaxID=6565 RepID=A0A8B8CJA2_CRAVI|nr:uncharacterized protein LOC111119401 isoform X2 [Crassostrea virginica]